MGELDPLGDKVLRGSVCSQCSGCSWGWGPCAPISGRAALQCFANGERLSCSQMCAVLYQSRTRASTELEYFPSLSQKHFLIFIVIINNNASFYILEQLLLRALLQQWVGASRPSEQFWMLRNPQPSLADDLGTSPSVQLHIRWLLSGLL